MVTNKRATSRSTPFNCALFTLLITAGCNGPQPLPPDSTRFDVTWDPATVVVSPADVAAHLTNPAATDGVYHFDAGYLNARAWTAGTVLVLSGVDLARVTSVSTGSDIVVTTEPASLADAATDADVSWSLRTDLSPVSTKSSLGTEALPTQPVVTVNGPFGGFGLRTMTTLAVEDSLFHFSGNVSMTQGKTMLTLTYDGKLQPFFTMGNVSIRNHKLESFYFKVDNLELDLTMNLSSIALGRGDSQLTYPITIKVPQAIGPIPTYVSLGAKIDLNPLESEKSSTQGQATYHGKGSAGLSYSNGTLTPFGTLDDSTVAFSDGAAEGDVNVGMGVLLTFPTVAVGVGPNIAGGEVSASWKNELVANLDIQSASSTCYTVDVNQGIYVAGEVRLAGYKIKDEIPLKTSTKELVKKGNACK
jgi:hypothetical protein